MTAKDKVKELERKLEYQKRWNDEKYNLTKKMCKRLEKIEQLTLTDVVKQSEQLCDCAMPDPIDPFAEVDKDTCRKCNNLIA